MTIILVAIAGYFYWIGSPFYTFQQVALAVKDHDLAQFRRYVDSDNLIDHLLDDLLVDPAVSTPHLSGFQRTVATGALAMAKSNIVKGMNEALRKSLSRESLETPTSHWQNFGMAPAIAAPIYRETTAPPLLAQMEVGTPGVKDLFNTAGHEISGELTRMKNTAYNRMFAYIQNHPDTVPGKLMNCPPEERAHHIRALLDEYGLAAKNFKGLGECKTTSDFFGREKCDVGLRFYSSKIDSEVTLVLAMDKDITTKDWRIVRLANIRDVMNQVEPNYERDIHELVEYSLSGMSNQNLQSDAQSLTSKLKKHPAAEVFLKRLQLFK